MPSGHAKGRRQRNPYAPSKEGVSLLANAQNPKQMSRAAIPQQVSEIELRYRSKVTASDRPECLTSEAAHELFRNWWDADCMELFEEFNVLLLDRAGRAIGIYRASQGGTVGTVVDPKLVFGAAIKCRAESIIIAHNHPSGQLRPSHADSAVTTKLVQAGKLLDIPVNDHIILSPEGGYYSFSDDGLI